MIFDRGTAYQAPVADLLTIGDARVAGVDIRVGLLGLDQTHVPELVRMMADPELYNAPSDKPEGWAPIHALRVIKTLDPSTHVAELIPLIERCEDDWFSQDLPKLFGQIGQPAVAPLQAYLADRSHNVWGHALVAHALEEIGRDHPALRDEVVAILSAVLHDAEQYDEVSCTFAMDALVELGAVEALPAIRHAFELDNIDTMVRGPWDSIVEQIGGELDPNDPLIASSWERDEERHERFFPHDLRERFRVLLGLEPESAFAHLAHEHDVSSRMSTNPTTLPQAEVQARKERQRRAEAQARKEKQKRKAASASRKANKNKKK